MQDARYSFGFEGPFHLLTPAGEVQAETVEPFFEGHGWEYDREYFEKIPALYRRKEPTALSGLEIFGVVFCFLGTCFAKKIFDEVYERTLKRPIGQQLDKLLKRVEVPVGKVLEYRDIIYFEDIDLVVVIRAVAIQNSGEELQNKVMQAHRVAHSYIEQHGCKAPIHCHKVVGGLISAEPELFSTLEEIKQHDRANLKINMRK